MRFENAGRFRILGRDSHASYRGKEIGALNRAEFVRIENDRLVVFRALRLGRLIKHIIHIRMFGDDYPVRFFNGIGKGVDVQPSLTIVR